MDDTARLNELYRIILTLREEIKQMNIQLRALRREVKGGNKDGTEN